MPKNGYNMRMILAGKSDPHKLGFTVLYGSHLQERSCITQPPLQLSTNLLTAIPCLLDGEIWRWWRLGFRFIAKVGNFYSTSGPVTFDGPCGNHCADMAWMRRDGIYTAMPPGTLLSKNWWMYGCFSPFFDGVSLMVYTFFARSVQTLMAKNSDMRCCTAMLCNE